MPQQPQSVKQTIVEMVKAMQADFGRTFQNQFHDPEVLAEFKNRLLTKLRGYPPGAIISGYEQCVDRNPKFCPTVPEIEASTKEIIKNLEQAEKNRIETQRLAALPAPTISCNPVEMFAKAKESHDSEKLTSEQRMKKRDEAMKNHNALLIIHSHLIKRVYADYDHLCKFPGCRKAGSISRGTKGGDNFYCLQHFRLV
ncbi:MAG: hypothetical protein KGI54_15095 [Pseudomonadota bacterium]|nr:hypothetical protein [Pseudomonadota bacterium]